jgi:hypothetical protein
MKMDSELEKVFNKACFTPGVSKDTTEATQSGLKIKFSAEYIDFLTTTNGYEGPLGNRYLVLWPVDKLDEFNKSYHVENFAPGLLLFGSDGGDIAYAFDVRSPHISIVEVPFIGMSLDEVKIISSTFYGFLMYLLR